MKSLFSFYSLFFSIAAFFIFSASVLAQNQSTEELPKAYITNELYVMLGGDAPQDAKVFEADILELHLATIEQADRFFSFFNDPSVEFETNIITQKVIVTLIPDAEKQNWNTTQWAAYLKNKVALQRQQFGTYIDFTKK